MKSSPKGRPGRQPMLDKREQFSRLIRQGVSISEACRRLEIDRKTGHWWKNGGSMTRNGVTRVIEPIVNQVPARRESGRYLSEAERVKIADGVHAGRSARSIAVELGRVGDHHAITAATKMPVYFCRPGRPWQRPSNENTNGLLRNYFPKSSDLLVHTPADLARVADELNRRPRKTLGWQTPTALFATLRTGSA